MKWKDLLTSLQAMSIPEQAVVLGVTIPADADPETLEYVTTTRGRTGGPYAHGVTVAAQARRQPEGRD